MACLLVIQIEIQAVWPDTKQFSVDKQCSLITSVSNFCYHHQNLLQFTKITTRIHVFWPCLKLHNWCFWSNSTLLSFCAPYRCKHKCLWGICCYSDMEHIHGRQARRSFCSRYRCKHKSPKIFACCEIVKRPPK